MSECIEWTGYRLPKGYGQIRRGGKNHILTRWTWEQEVGPIPEGKWVLHKCHNPPCYNIEHLYVGTPQANSDDMVKAGRHSNGRDRWTHCKQGHPLEGHNLIEWNGKRKCRTCHNKRVRDRNKRK